jgi:cytochrome c
MRHPFGCMRDGKILPHASASNEARSSPLMFEAQCRLDRRRLEVTSRMLLIAMLAAFAAPGAFAQAAPGELLFVKRCAGCHQLDRHDKGPALAGVLGRRAGTAPGYKYSAALAAAGFAWDERLLDRWLEDPSAIVQGARMKSHTRKADERRAVIDYLRSKSSH